MRSSTIYGLLFGVAAIFGGFYLEGGSLESLLLLPPILIVVGGTLAAGIIGTSFKQVLRIPRYIGVAISPQRHEIMGIINLIVSLAVQARREGILGIEKRLPSVDHPFLRKLLQVAIDGADPSALTSVAETEIEFLNDRHHANAQLFSKLGGYSPTMGIIGTVMGLIATLSAVGGDPNDLIRHIAAAFIATLWGIVMANLVWLPLADKLNVLHEEELTVLRVIVAGVTAVQSGETPSVIRARLIGVLPLKEQEEVLKTPLTNGSATRVAS